MDMYMYDMSLLISASIIKKSSGPKTVPCGTPLSTGESPLIAPGSLTKWDRLVRKLKNHIPRCPVIPSAFSL